MQQTAFLFYFRKSFSFFLTVNLKLFFILHRQWNIHIFQHSQSVHQYSWYLTMFSKKQLWIICNKCEKVCFFSNESIFFFYFSVLFESQFPKKLHFKDWQIPDDSRWVLTFICLPIKLIDCYNHNILTIIFFGLLEIAKLEKRNEKHLSTAIKKKFPVKITVCR